MPVLVPLFIGASAAAVAITVANAPVIVAGIVGVGAAVISKKTGISDKIYEEIVKPVGDLVIDVFKSDIGQFVLKAAAALTPGMQWAIPLIDAAGTLANGGDFSDALKSAAISYISNKVGRLGGELTSQALVDAGASEFATQVISSAAGSGAGSATVALIMNQDPVKAFIQGGISGGLSAAAGWLETNTEGAFSKLPDAARNVIISGLSAALTGKELTPDLVWNALLTSEGVTKTINNFLGENVGLKDSLTENQISALTLAIQRTTATAFSGGDVPDAILNQLSQYGEKEFGEWLDNSKFGDTINNSLDKITGDYQRTEAQAKKMDGVVQQHSSAVANYNSTVQQINAGVNEQERLRTIYDRALQNFQANENQTNADALTTAVRNLNNYAADFDTRYTNTLIPNLNRYEQQAADLAAQFDVEAEKYNTLVTDLSVSAERVAEDLKPVYNELDRQFVKFMDPNFNESEYRQIAGLDADDDAYLHWLSVGKEEGLPSNMAAYKEEYGSYRQNIINSVLDRAGLSLTDMTQFERAAFLADIDGRYPTLQDLRNAPTQTLADELLTNQSISDRATAKKYIAGSTQITPEINDALARAGLERGFVGEYLTQDDVRALTTPPVQTREEVVRPTDVTDTDIANGSAQLIVNNDGLLEWGRIEANVPYWDSNLKRLVKRTPYIVGTEFHGGYNLVDAFTGERVDNVLRLTITKNLGDLREENPSLFIQAVGGLSEAAGAIIDTQVGQAVSEFARNVVKYIQTPTEIDTSDMSPEAAAIAEYLVDKNNAYKENILNGAGLAAQAGGDILSGFNGLFIYANIDPKTTPFAGWADDLITVSTQLKTPEWQEAFDRADMRRRGIDPATGQPIEREFSRLNALTDFVGAIEEAPVQFVVEAIGVEVGQELISWFLGGAVTKVAKLSARGDGERDRRANGSADNRE